MSDRILVTARSFRATEGPHKQILRDAGYDLVECSQNRPLTAAELTPLMTDVVGAILGLDEVTAGVLAQAGRLKVISRFGVGTDSVDIGAATEAGIVVTITPGANSVAVAELTLGLILALARQIPYHDRVVRAGQWTRIQGIELSGAVLGIVGFGRIGREVGSRAAALGMRVLFYDPFPPEGGQAESCTIDELLARSDVISLHLPLTKATRNLIDARALALMKPSALLVNTARGGLVDEPALYEALASGKLAGAACDVFASEPPGDSPLLRADNFIGVPHIGSATLQTTLKMGLLASQNALAVLRGERPEGVVNPAVYDRIR